MPMMKPSRNAMERMLKEVAMQSNGRLLVGSTMSLQPSVRYYSCTATATASPKFTAERASPTTTISGSVRVDKYSQHKSIHPTHSAFSTMAMEEEPEWDLINDVDDHHNNAHHAATSSKVKHCPTCACDERPIPDNQKTFPCGSHHHEDEIGTLPPPLPEPSYSVHMRVLPPTLVALRSPAGKQYLQQALANDTAESYLPLIEQFVNQSDPAFCGVTTLCMVLNAMCVDPNVRWRGGWRWYGSEDMLLDRCCLSTERIKRIGISMEEFQQLGRCQGLNMELKRPPPQLQTDLTTDTISSPQHSLEKFRADLMKVLTTTHSSNNDAGISHVATSEPMLVVSFSRSELGQTGDGHFSPLGAYHEPSDSVLILDVARFKYAPYWVSVADLYQSMRPLDGATEKPRGWFVMRSPQSEQVLLENRHIQRASSSMMDDAAASATVQFMEERKERRRPADIVPLAGQGEACPLGKVRVEYCGVNQNRPR